MLLQRQHFLFSYFKPLNVGAARVRTRDLPHVDTVHAMWEDLRRRNREKIWDLEKKTQMRPKPLARDFILPNYSHHTTICGLSLHQGNAESRKSLARLVQEFIFQLGTLSPHGINERLSFH